MPVITTDSTNEPTISWHDSEGYFISDPPSDAGSYKLVVSIGGNENYEGKDVRLEFTISPVPAGDDQVTYSYANIIMSGMYASALNGGWRIGGIDLDGNGIDYSITYHRYNNDLGTRLGASNLLPAYILSSTDYGYFVKLTLDNNPNFATQEYYCDIDVHSTSKALDTQVSFTNTAYLYTDDSQFVLLKKPTTSMFESLKVYGSDGWPLEPLMEDFISGFNLYFAEDSKLFIIFNPGRSIALSGYIIRNTDNVHNAPADPENQTSFSILFQANSSSSRHILTFQMKTADEYYVTPDEGITAQEMYLDTNGEWQEGEIATNDDPYHDMDYDGGIRYFIIEVSASNNTLELVVVEDMM